jgi:hypothetical protein
VPPWELAEQPLVWRAWAGESMSAEAAYERSERRKAEAKAKARGRRR